VCNTALKEQIISLVGSVGKVKSDDASSRDLLEQFKDQAMQTPGNFTALLNCVSVNAFSRALGSAVRDKRLVRHRCTLQCIHDDERPVTILPAH
jgi:hypothetical protein